MEEFGPFAFWETLRKRTAKSMAEIDNVIKELLNDPKVDVDNVAEKYSELEDVFNQKFHELIGCNDIWHLSAF